MLAPLSLTQQRAVHQISGVHPTTSVLPCQIRQGSKAARQACHRKRQSRQTPRASLVGAGTPEDPNHIPDLALSSEPVTAANHDPTAEPTTPPSVFDRVKRFFGGDSLNRNRLAALGLGALASYGMVSNVTYGCGFALSWIAFVKQRALSPLQPGQWPVFLAFYAGFWTVQNFVRPMRFALAVSMAPLFDRFINSLPVSRKMAFGIYLVLLGTLTSVCVFGSIAVFAGPQAFSRAAIIGA